MRTHDRARHLGIALVTASFLLTLAVPTAAADGKDLFLENKCNNCHAVEKLGIERKIDNEKTNGADLTTTKHDAAWITSFIKKEIEKDGKKHLNTWKGNDKDLATLIAWVLSLKEA